MRPVPFRVVVLPYRRTAAILEYCLFKTPGSALWQAFAGEAQIGETPKQTAMREAEDKLGIAHDAAFVALNTKWRVPIESPRATDSLGQDSALVEEHYFGVKVQKIEVMAAKGIVAWMWCNIYQAITEANRGGTPIALWELNGKLLCAK